MGLDQYGMIGCTTEKRVDDAGNEYVVKLAEQDFYWRKHSRLQDFMENLWVKKLADQMLSLTVKIWCLLKVMYISWREPFITAMMVMSVWVAFSTVTNSKMNL